MLILGIDTSCDDTSAAVLRNGDEIVSNIVSNQTEIHRKYGGIVPELASRRHIEMIIPVVREALEKAGIGLADLSALAVCHGPGLIGSLLVGCSFAKAVSYGKGIPLVTVNHLEGHLFSAFTEENKPDFPFVALIVSGGHTSLYRVDDFGRYAELGRTRDDAAGEAYDKVSKLLGLGYPGGPAIDALAGEGDPGAIPFPRAYLPETLDFSFSGMKTAVLQFLRKRPAYPAPITDRALLADISASFQDAVVDVLLKKSEWALKKTGLKRLVLSGGVAANSALRKKMEALADKQGFAIHIPSRLLCTDNAAMIAAAGYRHFKRGNISSLDLNPRAYLPL